MAAVDVKKGTFGTTMDTHKAKSTLWTTVKPFLNGGLSGMGATCVIQPVDMIKVSALDLVLAMYFVSLVGWQVCCFLEI